MQDSLGTEIPSARHITHVLLGSGSRDCGGRLAGRLYPALVRPKLLSPLLSATARAALARPARCPPHSGQTFCRNGRRDSTRPVALQVGQSWSGFMVWSKSIWDERARSEKGKCSYRCQRPIVMITVSALDLSIQGVRSSLLFSLQRRKWDCMRIIPFRSWQRLRWSGTGAGTTCPLQEPPFKNIVVPAAITHAALLFAGVGSLLASRLRDDLAQGPCLRLLRAACGTRAHAAHSRALLMRAAPRH